MVQVARFELARITPLEPKSSVATYSTIVVYTIMSVKIYTSHEVPVSINRIGSFITGLPVTLLAL